MQAKYVHTNLIARDWRALAAWYTTVIGCTVVQPERDYVGAELEAGSGVPGAHLQGVHLRLPGYGADGPTLEVYSYNVLAEGGSPAVNRPGYAHIAFAVDDVAQARAEVLAHGGRPVGAIVTLTTSAGTRVTWCYVTDPEGNAIELQAWAK